MSASAVAARAAVPLAISNMEEEEQESASQPQQPQQKQQSQQLREEPRTGELELAADKLEIPEAEMAEPEVEEEEESMVLESPAAALPPGGEAESERQLQVDAQLRAMAVSTTTRTTPTGPRTNAAARAHHDAAPSTATSTGTRSAGESLDDVNGKDRLKPFVRTCKKFESGSGSGDQDGMVSMEDGVDVAAKKRKTRRGKPKHRKLKPYSKQQPSYQQRLRCRASGRPTKSGRQPPAPYNTTQFLMEDHNELPDLDEKIAGAATGPSAVAAAAVAVANEVHSNFNKPVAPPRTRDSSFSIDSDEEYFYSSPEDEEEFLTKEFSSAYEDLHAERLGTLTKTQLILEYIQLEAKVDMLTKRLRAKNAAEREAASGESRDAELTKKLKVFQQRIDELQEQNEQLLVENEMLRRQKHGGSPMSSVDSESDSESSSNASDCSCNHKTSPGSSPVPASYHACRVKTNSRWKNSSVSSVGSETDSTTNDCSCPDASPKTPSTGTTTATTGNTSNGAPEVSNGHAASYEIGLPT